MPVNPPCPSSTVIAITPIYEIEKAIERATMILDPTAIVRSFVEDATRRLLGRV
jgi:hypothetical protein